MEKSKTHGQPKSYTFAPEKITIKYISGDKEHYFPYLIIACCHTKCLRTDSNADDARATV